MNAKLIMATVKLININASIMMVVLNVIVLMVSPPLSPARIGFNSNFGISVISSQMICDLHLIRYKNESGLENISNRFSRKSAGHVTSLL